MIGRRHRQTSSRDRRCLDDGHLLDDVTAAVKTATSSINSTQTKIVKQVKQQNYLWTWQQSAI